MTIQATTTPARFEVGATYQGRFVTDYDSTFRRTVTKRTDKSVWLTDGRDVKQFRIKMTYDGSSEYCEPMGRYSMSPDLRASKRVA